MLKATICCALLAVANANGVTGKCTGNTDSQEDVDCSGETTDTENKGSSVDGTTLAECCQEPTPVTGKCTGNTDSQEDVDCSGETTDTENKGSSVDGTTLAECCQAPTVTGKCTGNTDSQADVDCSGETTNTENKGSSVDGTTGADCCQAPTTYAAANTPATCTETAETSVADDKAKCDAVTALEDKTKCEEVKTEASASVGACTYTAAQGTCEGSAATCTETAETSVADDKAKCEAVTALDDNTKCEEVKTEASASVGACTYTAAASTAEDTACKALTVNRSTKDACEALTNCKYTAFSASTKAPTAAPTTAAPTAAPTTAAPTAAPTAAAAGNATAATKDQVTVSLTTTLEFAEELSTEDLAKAATEFCAIAKKESGVTPSSCTLTKAAARRRLLSQKYTGSVSYVVDEEAVAALTEAYESNTFADAVVASEEFKTINGGTALAKPTVTVKATQDGKEYSPVTTTAAKKDYSSASALLLGAGAMLAIFL